MAQATATATQAEGTPQERAWALLPLIREHADAAQQNRRLSEAVVEALHDSGLFRMCLPREFGGEETDPWTTVETIEAISYADGSTGSPLLHLTPSRASKGDPVISSGRVAVGRCQRLNAVQANLLAGAVQRDLRGEVVNIACGTSVSLLELLDKMARNMGAAAEFDTEPARVGDVLHSRADISAARELLGYEPVTTLDEGLAQV